MSLFSIIIPTFNRPTKLQEILELLTAQIFKDFEVIIIEDLHNHQLIINQYRSKLNIKYQYIYQKCTVTKKRNIGAQVSSGNYLIFLDDDDAVTSNWLYDFNAEINRSELDIVFCGVVVKLKNGKEKHINAIKPYTDERGWGVFLSGAFVIRKELFFKCGMYDELLTYGENTEFSVRVKEFAQRYEFISNQNFIYNYSTGASKSVFNTYNSTKYVINKHKNWFEDSPILYSNYLSVLAITSFKLGKYEESKHYISLVLKLKPYYLKQYLRYIGIYFPFIGKMIWKNSL